MISVERKRITEVVKNLPINRMKMEELLMNNAHKDIEVIIYGNRAGKAEKTIKKQIQKLGINPKIKNSQSRRSVIVKLNKHMKFIILEIEGKEESIYSEK